VGSTNTERMEVTLLLLDWRRPPTPRGELCGCPSTPPPGPSIGAEGRNGTRATPALPAEVLCGVRCENSTGASPRGEGMRNPGVAEPQPPALLPAGFTADAPALAKTLLLRRAGRPAGSLPFPPAAIPTSRSAPTRFALLVTACSLDWR